MGPGSRVSSLEMTRRLLAGLTAATLAAAGGLGLGAQAPGPQPASARPASGSGSGRVFTFTFSSPDDASDVEVAEALIVTGDTISGFDNCYFFSTGGRLWLRDDAHSTWLGPLQPGSPATLSNSQCTLFGAGFSISSSGGHLVLTVPVTFTAAYAGPKTVYARTAARSGQATDLVPVGTWTATVQNPPFDVITSSCADASRDPALGVRTSQEGVAFKYLVTPECFPAYAHFLPIEGWFVEGDRRPLPVMGRTCGHFDVLVVFIDTDVNRRKLLDNPTLPPDARALLADGRVHEGLTTLFATYTDEVVMRGFTSRLAAQAVSFSFTVATTRLTRRQLDLDDDGLGFSNYDAVLVLTDLGSAAANGVDRWPAQLTRPLFFGGGGSFHLHIDPLRLMPALFGHELLHRNVPWGMKEYQYGERLLVVEGGITYERTPVVNPRTGENIEALLRANAGRIPISEYLGGFSDVDGDGVVDCRDPVITPTADNLDGDFVPDRFDPDLTFGHRPRSWLYAPSAR